MKKEIGKIRQNFENLKLTIEKVAKRIKSFVEKQNKDVITKAKSGWFPNWYTIDCQPQVNDDYDTFMRKLLENRWQELTSKIIESCANREAILKTAFHLHEEKNYIASIPLFLSQADGIWEEKAGTFLFADNRSKPIFKGEKTKKYFKKESNAGKLPRGIIEDYFLAACKYQTQFSESISDSKARGDNKGPNRHGILHGDKDHVDYGTELNSLKSLSLLAFVVCFTDKFEDWKQKKENQRKKLQKHFKHLI